MSLLEVHITVPERTVLGELPKGGMLALDSNSGNVSAA